MHRPFGVWAWQNHTRGLTHSWYRCVQHYSKAGIGASAHPQESPEVDVTFTATSSATGSLLLGSSRELSWNQQPEPEVVQAILDRARTFLPTLGDATPELVRVGLRPLAVRGKPCVGPVGEGLFVAAGHEGSGLLLAPITAKLISDYILLEGTSSVAGAASLLPVAQLVGAL